jgi:hypothetical protein
MCIKYNDILIFTNAFNLNFYSILTPRIVYLSDYLWYIDKYDFEY